MKPLVRPHPKAAANKLRYWSSKIGKILLNDKTNHHFTCSRDFPWVVPRAFADDGLNDGEVQSASFSHEHEKLTEEIRTVFEIYLAQDQSGLWRVNDVKSAAAAGIEGRDLEIAARNLNSVGMSNRPAGDGNSTEKIGDEGWVRCVLSWSVGSGVIKLLDGTAVGWLKAGKYAKFASWLLRVAPRVALRGGAAGIVGGLVAGVVACSISNG